MKQLDTDLWVVEAPLRFLGVEVGARMTVVRLRDDLWIHSPVSSSPELIQQVESLGRVAYLIAPNRFHHLYVGMWQRAFPEAAVYVAPGLETKRSDLRIEGVLGETPETGWAEALDQVFVAGFPLGNEIVFFHRASASLIASDLAFNFGASSPPLTRFAMRLGGAYGRLSPTLLERLLVRDRPAFGGSLAKILEWPFERVIVAHGDVCETGGRGELERGYSWVLERANAVPLV